MDSLKGWVPKSWCHRTVVLEKTLESPLDCKEIKPVYPKENQPWIFLGRTDTEAEAPIVWPPDGKNWLKKKKKNWLIGKGPDAGKDWRLEKKGTIKDEIVGWHHWLNGHEFEQTLGDGEGHLGSCCTPGGHKESDRKATEQQLVTSLYGHLITNWNELRTLIL